MLKLILMMVAGILTGLGFTVLIIYLPDKVKWMIDKIKDERRKKNQYDYYLVEKICELYKEIIKGLTRYEITGKSGDNIFKAQHTIIKIYELIENDVEQGKYVITMYKYRDSCEIIIDQLKQAMKLGIAKDTKIHERIRVLMQELLQDLEYVKGTEIDEILGKLEDELEIMAEVRRRSLTT